MKLNKISLALGLASVAVIAGCNDGGSSDTTGDSSENTGGPSSTYSVTAIDGYLIGALVWLDLDKDFALDENEPSATTGKSGIADLDVSGVENPEMYPVVVKAIAGQTVDETTGLVETDYAMSAPPGETDVTPLSTLVHLILEQTTSEESTEEEISQAKQAAVAQVASNLGISNDDVLGDFLEGTKKSDVAFAAETLVSQSVLPTTSDALGDAADGSDSQILVKADTVSKNVKVVIVNSGSDLDNVDLTTDSDSDGVPDVLDSFPDDATEQYDFDGDDIGDNADLDDDNDDVNDIDDAFPTNSAETVDTDGDRIGNNADPDDDNDGVADEDDSYPLDDTRAGDRDEDGVDDLDDAFPDDNTKAGDSDGDGIDSLDDEYPNDPTRAGDRDEDGVDDLDDAFPDDGTKAGDRDGDSYDDLVDWAPDDVTEWLDTDNDNIGNNADTDDDNDGVLDEFDSAPLDAQVDESSNAIAASMLSQQSHTHVIEGDIDDRELTLQTFDITNGLADAVSIAEVNTFGLREFSMSNDEDYVLTGDGWTQLDGVYTLDFSGGDNIIAYATHFTDVMYDVTAQFNDLSGQNVSGYVASKEIWNQFKDEMANFSDNAFDVSATLTPVDDIYYLIPEDRPWIFRGDGGASDGNSTTTLEELFVATSVGEKVSTGILKGAMLSGDGDYAGAVEFVEGGVANFYSLDWANRDPDTNDTYATSVASGTWESKAESGVEWVEFTVPEDAITAWGDMWDEDSATVIFSIYDGELRRGFVDKQGISIDDEPVVFVSDSAKNDILSVITPPLGLCEQGDTDTATSMQDFNNAVNDCGGAEAEFSVDMVSGLTFERDRSDGSTRQYTFAENGDVYVGKNGTYSYAESWEIVGGRVHIYGEQYDWYWSLLKSDDGVWSLKFYEEYTDGGVLSRSVWSDFVEQINEAICPFYEVETGATREDFSNAVGDYASCAVVDLTVVDSDLQGKTLTRTSSRGEVRAYEFDEAGSTGTYYRNAVNAGAFKWMIVDGHQIEIADPDDVSSVSDVLVILQNSGDNYLIADYVPENGEIWSDSYQNTSALGMYQCVGGDTEWDDVNDRPKTTGSFDDYLTSIQGCSSDLGQQVWFSNEFFDRTDRAVVLSTDSEEYTVHSDGTGTLLVDDETHYFTWSIDSENDLFVATIAFGANTAIDRFAIVDTNGKYLSVKAMSKADADGWPGIGDDDEGDIWSNVFMLNYLYY